MPKSSGWPLKTGDIRFFVPLFASNELARNPLTQSLFVNGMGLYVLAANHHMQRPEHEDNLLMYCSAGAGWVEANGERHPVKAGDLIALPVDTPHEYGSDQSHPWTLYWVHFSGDHAPLYWQHIAPGDTPCVVPIGLHPKMISDFETLFSARETGYSMKAFVHASQCLKQMLAFIAMLSSKHTQNNRQVIDLDAIQTVMQSKLHTDLQLEQLAQQAKLSKYHFSKRYKALTGYAPIQHFIHLKMERACYLLDISDQSISQIAANLGYEDPHYFSRLFKKVTGLSPREYRKIDRG